MSVVGSVAAARPRWPRAAGWGLAAVVGAIARVRPAAKPMHPRGETHVARIRPLTTVGPAGGPGTGAAFIDRPVEGEVVVRFSRSVGLPAPLPDVDGLAIRVPIEDGAHADILLSSTGRGRLTRFLLLPATAARGRFVSSMLPHRSPTGPVLLAARWAGDVRWDLLWARPRGPWTPFAHLDLIEPTGHPDRPLSFDAVRAAPDGLEVYDWHRDLRGPSYAGARRARSGGAAPDPGDPS